MKIWSRRNGYYRLNSNRWCRSAFSDYVTVKVNVLLNSIALLICCNNFNLVFPFFTVIDDTNNPSSSALINFPFIFTSAIPDASFALPIN
jgi:hypothetical protein